MATLLPHRVHLSWKISGFLGALWAVVQPAMHARHARGTCSTEKVRMLNRFSTKQVISLVLEGGWYAEGNSTDPVFLFVSRLGYPPERKFFYAVMLKFKFVYHVMYRSSIGRAVVRVRSIFADGCRQHSPARIPCGGTGWKSSTNSTARPKSSIYIRLIGFAAGDT